MANPPSQFTGDVLVVQAKNNDVELCNSGATKYFTSSGTYWTVTCGTLTFTMTNNGAAGHVSGKPASSLDRMVNVC